MALTKVAQLPMAAHSTIAVGVAAGAGFGNAAGNDLIQRRYGPGIASGGLGWSARVHNTFPYVPVTGITTVQGTLVCLDQWYYFSTLDLSASGSNYLPMGGLDWNYRLEVKIGTVFQRHRLTPSVHIFDNVNGGAIPTRKWLQFRYAYRRTSAAQDYDVEVYWRQRGDVAWTLLISDLAIQFAANPARSAFGFQIGDLALGSTGISIDARFGLPTVWTSATWADRLLLPATEFDPPAHPYDFWLDPVEGSDTNDGTTKALAWKSASFLQAELQGGAFFARNQADVYQNADGIAYDCTKDADVIEADYSTGALTCKHERLNIAYNAGAEQRIDGQFLLTPGLSAISETAGSQPNLTHLKQVTGWAKTAGRANIYESTDFGNTNTRLWQNRRHLTHVAGASTAAALTTLDAVKGAYHNDGTKLYVYPLDGIDPSAAASGTPFERSQFTGTGATGFVNAENNLVRDQLLSGTGLSDVTTNLAIGGYPFGGQATGLNIFHRCIADLYDKHGVMNSGILGANYRGLYLECEAGRGNTDTNFGGQTAFGDHGTVSCVNGQAYWRGCKTIRGNVQKVNQADGDVNLGQLAYITHGDAPATNFTKLFFVGLDMRRAGLWSMQNDSIANIRATQMYSCFGLQPTAVIEDCTMDECGPILCTIRRSTMTLQNPSPNNTNDQFRMNATGVAEDCVFDLRACATGKAPWNFFVSYTSKWTFRRCKFYLSLGSYLFLSATAASNKLKLVDCVFVLPAAQPLLGSYNDGTTTADRTLSQMAALGIAVGCSQSTVSTPVVRASAAYAATAPIPGKVKILPAVVRT